MLSDLLQRFRTRLLLEKYKTDWPRTILLILLILAVSAALWQWAMPQVKVITQNQFHQVPVIHTLEKIKTVTLPGPAQIVVIDKVKAAEKLHLDDMVKADQSSQITSSAELPESDNGIDVVSLMDMETGETHLVAREKTAPWFQFRNDGAVGLRYGVNQKLEYVSTVYGRWDFLRVRNIYLSANGDLSSGADAKIQLGAEYRW